ncbi:MAG: hypothetical protein KGJ24_00090 [Burkholderiales bacterium]|nr:hypothetical protein [Burkholderiales bacterium]MDE2567261.1 hypothetical protein [Burkholderiales bacterium]
MAFTPDERTKLLAQPRIGPLVLQRLEQAGLDSVSKLQALGVDAAVLMICDQLGSIAWANRRRPLRRAIAVMVGG